MRKLLLLFCTAYSLLNTANTTFAQEVKRYILMPYVCGLDSNNYLALQKTSKVQAYPIQEWSAPYTENIRVGQGAVEAELFDFTFKCSGNAVFHVMDLYVVSDSGAKWGAHRKGNKVVFNAGTERVATSHTLGQCQQLLNRTQDFAAYGDCVDSAGQSEQRQVWGEFPARRAPIPRWADVKVGDLNEACKKYPDLC